ncbi:hypothetical protein [Mesorhizobium sp. 1B3]|uniref:hypothetical protein n=1 Tax=Mesorhizobium sp. 1B3 TaxID=3243599 RepID=UPI003D95512A
MLDEDHRDPAALSSNLGAEVPFVRPPQLGDGAPTSDQGADNAGRLQDSRPVRLGRAPATVDSAQVGPGPASVKGVLADMANRRSAGSDVAKGLADLNAKFDAMKESFDLLEAHVAIGLSRSIADTLKAEAATLEQQIVLGHRYRARYRLALGIAFLLAAAIVADQYRPFIAALFEPLRQVAASVG